MWQITTLSSHFDTSFGLSRNDISFNSRTEAKVTQLRIHLNASKTDTFRQGTIIKLFKIHGQTCPITASIAFLRQRDAISRLQSCSAPLFATPNREPLTRKTFINTLRPRQNGRHFPDDIFKCIFLNENVWISIEISLKLVAGGPTNNFPALVQIMAWRRPGDKPLSELMIVSLLTHICVTRPQGVNMLNQLCIASGLNPSLYSGHSLRISATTSAAKRAVSDHLIQVLGRWRSDCYKVYIRTSNETLHSAYIAMSRA